jgi:hypothetical protein
VGEENMGGSFNQTNSNGHKRVSQKKLKKVNDSLEFEAIEDESQNEKSQNNNKSKDNQP